MTIPGKPQFCDITLTPRCVLECKMCRAWHAPADSPALSFEECKQFVDELSEFVDYPLEINVMGGEPLMVPWCLDLCDYIAEKGFRSIISTNGVLIDEPMARRIADSKLNVLAISIESLVPEVHDFYRGKQGTLEKVLQGIKYLKKYRRDDLCITILSVIMKRNLDSLPDLIKWVDEEDLFENISLLALLETGLVNDRKDWFKSETYAELWPDHSQLVDFINRVIKLRAQGARIWNPYSQLESMKDYYLDPEDFMRRSTYSMRDLVIDLDERKNVYLSGEKLGILDDVKLEQKWGSTAADEIRKKIDKYGSGDRSCVINFVCAFEEDKTYLEKNHILRDLIERAKQDDEIRGDEADLRLPKFSVIEVTRNCPMRCRMCFNWQAENNEELSFNEITSYVDDLCYLTGDGIEINLAGGEPLSRADIFEIVKYIRAKGCTVSLTTAGYLLDDDMLAKVRQSGVTLMPMSLDSLDPVIHDEMRGREGTHERVMHALESLREDPGSLRNLTIQTILMRPNLKGIPDLVKWASERDIAVSLMAIMRPNGISIDPKWYKKKEYSFLWPKRREVNKVIDKLIRLKEDGARIDNSIAQLEAFKTYYKNPEFFIKDGPCSLGDGIVNVSPEGNMFLCWEKGALGNIKYDKISELWFSKRAQSQRASIKACQRNCSEMVNCFFEGRSKRNDQKVRAKVAQFFKAFFKKK